MPHPDYRIVDVPLRLDQVHALIRAVDIVVGGGHLSSYDWKGPMAQLVGALPDDSPHLRPGPEHWLYKE